MTDEPVLQTQKVAISARVSSTENKSNLESQAERLAAYLEESCFPKQRISIGVSFDQRTPPAGTTPQEQFWNIINRYSIFQRFLSPQNMLEFRMYPNVQYMSNTFISKNRYKMVEDAELIIDAYYSQGMALAMVTS